MIREQIVSRGVADPRVLEAFCATPREWFVPPHLQHLAYEDSPQPLVHGQTISQPSVHARYLQELHLTGREKVLEIGTGSGYQTAILARLARVVYSAEVEPELAASVRERLHGLGIRNVVFGTGNGVEIFRNEAPFDAILSAAAPAYLPDRLLDQLAEGGRCIIPVGGADLQHLWRIERVNGRLVRQRLEAVRFVPLREKA